jgi:hypothetical protein
MSAARGGRHVPPKRRFEAAWTKCCWAEAVECSDGPPHSCTAVAGGAPEGGMNSGANCCSRGHQEWGSTRPPLEDSMATVTVAMREEERRGTGQRRGTRKRRVRNE